MSFNDFASCEIHTYAVLGGLNVSTEQWQNYTEKRKKKVKMGYKKYGGRVPTAVIWLQGTAS